MKDADWKVLMHSLSLYVQAIPFSNGTSQEEQNAIADHMIGVAEYIETHPQPPFMKAFSEALDRANLQIDELKLAVKESNADADALILLSKGLYERIQGKPDWVVASNCQTALNFIDELRKEVVILHGQRNSTLGPCACKWCATEKPKCDCPLVFGECLSAETCDYHKPKTEKRNCGCRTNGDSWVFCEAHQEAKVCVDCGWNNDANHGGGSRVMHTFGKITRCAECLPISR